MGQLIGQELASSQYSTLIRHITYPAKIIKAARVSSLPGDNFVIYVVAATRSSEEKQVIVVQNGPIQTFQFEMMMPYPCDSLKPLGDQLAKGWGVQLDDFLNLISNHSPWSS